MEEPEITYFPSDDEAPLVNEDTRTMAVKSGVLTPNLFIVFVPAAFYAVLVISFWLTEDRDNGINIAAIFSCELAILTVSIIAMTIFIMIDVKGKPGWKPLRLKLSDIRAQQIQHGENPSCLVNLPVREIMYVLLCTGSIALTIFHVMSILYQSLPSMSTNNCLDVTAHVLTYLFCLMQGFFVIHYRNCALRNRLLRYLVALILASDCCIFITYVFFFERQIHINNEADFPFFPIPRSHRLKAGTLTNLTQSAETYLFFCIVEYALFSALFLGKLWIRTTFESKSSFHEMEQSSKKEPVSILSSIGHSQDGSTRSAIFRKIIHYLRETIRFISEHSFYVSTFVCVAIAGMNLALSIIGTNNKKADGGYSSKTAEMYAVKVAIPLETCITYVSSGVAFAGYILSQGEDSKRHVRKSDRRLLLFTAFVFMILAIIETIESGLEVVNDTDKDVGTLVAYCFFTFCQYVFLYCQTQTILKVTQMKVDLPITFKQLVLRGICVYLGIFSIERWIEASFLTPIDLIQTNHLSHGFGLTNWWAILSTLYPFVAFYYLFSAVMCFEMVVRYPNS